MNREIKFRGLVADESNTWVYGYLVANNMIAQVEEREDSKCCGVGTFIVIPETVGQFTGLYDKNSVEIYEGDIIKIHYFYEGYDVETLGAVELEKDISGIVSLTTPLGIYIDTKDESQNYLSEYLYNLSLEEYPEQLEVTGNIYEVEDVKD